MIIYGKQIFLHILYKMPQIIEKVYLAKECDKKLFSHVKRLNVPILNLDFKKAQALAKGRNHQGFLAQIKPLEFCNFEDIKSAKFIMMLCGVSDVGNIGAICRSAYAFGVDALIISGVKSVSFEDIIRTSSGAALEQAIVLQPDTLGAINELKQSGFYVYCADAKGEDVKKVSIKEKALLLMGSEGDGISRKIMQKSDKIVKINMVRDFNSLNVSVAAAILCDRMING